MGVIAWVKFEYNALHGGQNCRRQVNATSLAYVIRITTYPDILFFAI